jgi:hypothetical protein
LLKVETRTTIRRLLFFSAMMIVAALLCFSVATVRVAIAADLNASAPASGVSGQATPYQIPASPSPAQAQNASTDPLSQTPAFPLVPFQLTIANQTVSEPTSPSPSATLGPSQTEEVPSAASSADAASGSAAHSADTVTTNVTQPVADNGSLAPIPPVSGGGGGSGLILMISLSYGTAIVVLALMRYWSFSFDEGGESSSELNNADVVYGRGSAYSTLENVEYAHTAEGP